MTRVHSHTCLCEVGPLVVYHVMGDSMPVDQAFCQPPQRAALADILCIGEANHAQNIYP